jgi:ABC-type branched-subunit amino acid transport system ATPase component
MSVAVRVQDLEKNFGRYPALKGVSLNVAAGELVALLGPSGSGKTTLLRAVAGLEQADGGHVFFGDIDANGLPLRERRIGFVFQHYALFRHMRVFDNVAFITIGAWKQGRYPGVAGHEPVPAESRAQYDAVTRAAAALRPVTEAGGSYSNEGSYFEQDWRTQFWGSNYPRLLRIKRRYDPSNLFRVHKGVGAPG